MLLTGCLALLIKKYIIYISNRNRIQQIHNSLVICGSQEDEENNNNNNIIIVSPSSPNVESYAISLLDYNEVVVLFPILICVVGMYFSGEGQ